MAEFIRTSLLFPVIQSIHLIGLTMVIGTISLVDFRLIGLGLRRYSISDLASSLTPWTIVGAVTIVLTGPLMFWADMSRYSRNSAFMVKMALLAVALLHHFTIHRGVTLRHEGESAGRQRLAAAISLTLWSAVVLAARAIADFDAL